jgi:hypothetical protein
MPVRRESNVQSIGEEDLYQVLDEEDPGFGGGGGDDGSNSSNRWVKNPVGEGTAGDGRGLRNKRLSRCLCYSAAGAALFVAVYVALVYSVGPSAAAATCKQATLSLIGCNMSDPSPTSIELECDFTLNNGGSIAGKMHSTSVQLATSTDEASFGHMEMPEVSIAANAPSSMHIESRIVVTDIARFTTACFSVLQGHPAKWRITGYPDITVSLPGLTPTFSNVFLDKYMDIPATLLKKLEAHDVNILGTTATSLHGVLQASFFSSSVLQLLDLGKMTFAIYNADGVQIGTSFADNFAVQQGFNQLSNLTVVVAPNPPGSKRSRAGVTDFVRSYIGATDQELVLRGPVANSAPFLNNLVSQPIVIPGVNLMDSIQVTSLKILSGTKSLLTAVSVVEFVSNSVLQKGSLGDLQFEIYTVAGPDAGDKGGVFMGSVHLGGGFEVKKGLNKASATVTLPAPSTPEGHRAVARFVGAFCEGFTTHFEMRGPVKNVNPMLNGLIKKPVTILGTPDPSLMLSVFSDKGSNVGFNVPGRKMKLRGAIVVSKNPYDVPITISNIQYDVHLEEPLKWVFKDKIMTLGKRHQCGGVHGENRYARMFYAPGMHLYPKLCPHEHCNQRDMNATVRMLPGTVTSFFVPAIPMPGQGRDGCCPVCNDKLSPFDCCYTSLTLAAACRAQQRHESHFMGRSNGTMDMAVGEFQLYNVSYAQNELPTIFAPDITEGMYLDQVLDCRDIEIIF